MSLCDFCGEKEDDCTCATSKIRDERDQLCAAINRSTSELTALRAKCERLEGLLREIVHLPDDDLCGVMVRVREALAQPENQSTK